MPRKSILPRVIDIGRRYSMRVAPTPARPSTASAVFPGLRRLDLNANIPVPSPAPSPSAPRAALLTLHLTDASFLETLISDGDTPIYAIDTHGTRTIVTRTDFVHGASQVGCVTWPEDIAKVDITVQMGTGRAKPADAFLKFGSYFTYAMLHFPVVQTLIFSVALANFIYPTIHMVSSGDV